MDGKVVWAVIGIIALALIVYAIMWLGVIYLSPLWSGSLDWWQTIVLIGIVVIGGALGRRRAN